MTGGTTRGLGVNSVTSSVNVSDRGELYEKRVYKCIVSGEKEVHRGRTSPDKSGGLQC